MHLHDQHALVFLYMFADSRIGQLPLASLIDFFQLYDQMRSRIRFPKQSYLCRIARNGPPKTGISSNSEAVLSGSKN